MKFQDIREECCKANQSLFATKLVDLTFGNISILDSNKGVFAIKPSGVAYEALQPQDMVIIAVEDGKIIEGSLRPSSDTPTHRYLFQSLPDIRAIGHTHSRYAVSFAQARQPIPCLGTTHADYFYGNIALTRQMTDQEIRNDYEWNTGRVIVEGLNKSERNEPLKHRAILVQNHGPFVWGRTGAEVVEVAQALELIAEIALKTLQLAPTNPEIPKSLLDKHFSRKHGDTAYYGQSV